MALISCLIFTIFTTPMLAFAQEKQNDFCINSQSFQQVKDEKELLKLAVKQHNDRLKLNPSLHEKDIVAVQLVKSDKYKSGKVEETYTATGFILVDPNTGMQINSDSFSTSYTQHALAYNVSASLTAYMTIIEDPLSLEAWTIRCSQIQSSVSYTMPGVAYFKHGITADGYPPYDFYTSATVGVPAPGSVYTLYPGNDYYYGSTGMGGCGFYNAFLDVTTTNMDTFSLLIDIAQYLQGIG